MKPNKLKQALDNKNETPERLAEALYVDPRSVRNWINGKNTPRRGIQIAIGTFLGISVKEAEALFK